MYTDGLFGSAEAAATWTFLGTPPLPPGIILPDPFAPATVYVGGIGGVSRTADGGGSWTTLTRGSPAGQAGLLVFDPSDSGTLYAVAAGALVRITVSDGGASC